MTEEARGGGDVLVEQLVLQELRARREDDGLLLARRGPAHRERDHGGEIGERFPDARSALELRDAPVLQDVHELARELDLLLADAVAGKMPRTAFGIGEGRGDRAELEGHGLLVARTDREVARLGLRIAPTRRARAHCRRRTRRSERRTLRAKVRCANAAKSSERESATGVVYGVRIDERAPGRVRQALGQDARELARSAAPPPGRRSPPPTTVDPGRPPARERRFRQRARAVAGRAFPDRGRGRRGDPGRRAPGGRAPGDPHRRNGCRARGRGRSGERKRRGLARLRGRPAHGRPAALAARAAARVSQDRARGRAWTARARRDRAAPPQARGSPSQSSPGEPLARSSTIAAGPTAVSQGESASNCSTLHPSDTGSRRSSASAKLRLASAMLRTLFLYVFTRLYTSLHIDAAAVLAILADLDVDQRRLARGVRAARGPGAALRAGSRTRRGPRAPRRPCRSGSD